MSSLCALWNQSGQPDVRNSLEKMQGAQAIYGQDRRFSWSDGRIALGGNLMRFLPEDVHDAQPVWTFDRMSCLVGDIRLDNRGELIRDLGLTAPECLADSDILLASWQRWGRSCVEHIFGGFAFAVWTPSRNELFAARDHVGERPLFFHRGPGFFALASMPKGLLALPGVFQGFNERRLVDAMALSAPDWSESYFKGIERLPMGHYVVVTPDGCDVRSYWHPSQAKPIRFKRDQDYAEALLEVFDDAVAVRMRSTRGIASQLSSGLDSSSVTASAATQLARQGRRLTAYTAIPRPEFQGKGFRGRVLNEGPFAGDVARMYPNVDHVQFDSAGVPLMEAVRQWTDAMDEPVQNTTNLIWELASLQLARDRGCGVMLQAPFGNATISFESGGALTDLFRRGRWLKLFQTIRSLRGHGDLSWRNGFLDATNGLLPRTLKDWINPRFGPVSLAFSPASPEIIAKHDLVQRTRDRYFGDRPSVAQERSAFFSRFDFGPIQAACRAVSGIDFRDPAGDKRVFDFCYAIPIEQYIVGGHSRSLVRRAMKGRLPEATLSRYARGQQSVDWYLNVAEALPALAQEFGRIQQSPASRYFLDLPRIGELLHTWPETGHDTEEATFSWNYSLTRGIGIGYFLQQNEQLAELVNAGPIPPHKADGAAPAA